MLPVFEEDEKTLIQAIKLDGIDQKYSVKKKIQETSLYSIYLISAEEQPNASNEVLLIEHPPAKEASVHILPIKIKGSATMTETIEEIVRAVRVHFAQSEYWFR